MLKRYWACTNSPSVAPTSVPPYVTDAEAQGAYLYLGRVARERHTTGFFGSYATSKQAPVFCPQTLKPILAI
jgi:hypothetical protein